MSLNKVTLIGHVGSVNVKTLQNGVKVANVSIATNQKGYTKKSGEVIEPRTEWHSVVLWRNLANTIEQYVKVGMHLYIEGELRSRIWRDKEGVDHYTTEVMANTMQMLGSKKDNMQSVPKVVETHHNEEQHQQLQDDTNIDDDLPF